MLVESGEKAQQALREFFSKLGFRVLLTENPQRAIARFSSIPLPADFLVISSRELGAAAVKVGATRGLSAGRSVARRCRATVLRVTQHQAELSDSRSEAKVLRS
jgi:hypothetical protein